MACQTSPGPVQRTRSTNRVGRACRRSDNGLRLTRHQALHGGKLRWQEALDEFRAALQTHSRDKGFYCAACTTALAACGREKRWPKSVDLLWSAWLVGDRLEPNSIVCGAALAAASRGTHGWSRGLVVLEESKQRAVSPNAGVYRTAASASSQNGHKWDLALQLLVEAQSQALETGAEGRNVIISACGSALQWEQSAFLVDAMRHDGIVPTAVTAVVAAGALRLASLWQASLSLLAVVAWGVELHVVALNTAIASWEAGRGWSQALALLQAMRSSRRTPPDMVSYNSVISACSWRQGLELLNDAASRALQLDAFSYNSAMRSGRSWQLAACLLGLMHKRTVRADAVSLSTAAGSCGSEAWAAASAMLSAAAQSGIRLNTAAWNSGQAACAESGLWERALTALWGLESRGLQADVTSLTIALVGLGRARSWRVALLLLERGRQAGLELQEITWSAAVSACERGQEWSAALSLLQELRASRLQLQAMAFGAAISACGQKLRWQSGLALLHWMRQAGTEVTVTACSAAISTCGQSSSWHEALQLLDDMLHSRLPANLISINAVLAACAGSGELEVAQDRRPPPPHVALKLLCDLRAMGLKPDVLGFAAALQSCDRSSHSAPEVPRLLGGCHGWALDFLEKRQAL
ncbi:unnamed protein product [Polarella glacialis]|uniref:Pentatricopeptide repeat-containing protein, chloroplastic n=1 Tax=Polarella glacialis TaxID=89957 RepID=A0A813K4U2_POLGL|nr:unnamed protein product [Polarella glacialis]CAE8691264.1 unnamed protein product [Polarella glacialis]